MRALREAGGVAGVEQVRRFLRELGDVDEAGEVLQVAAFVVELSEIVMLSSVSLPQGREGVHSVRPCKRSGQTGKSQGRYGQTHVGAWLEACS